MGIALHSYEFPDFKAASRKGADKALEGVVVAPKQPAQAVPSVEELKVAFLRARQETCPNFISLSPNESRGIGGIHAFLTRRAAEQGEQLRKRHGPEQASPSNRQ
jgi:hypothetical protein